MPDAPAEVRENEVVMTFGDRRYRVRGLAKNLAYDVLKVNVLAARNAAFHVDTLDLYSARARASYHTQAAVELQHIKLRSTDRSGNRGIVVIDKQSNPADAPGRLRR